MKGDPVHLDLRDLPTYETLQDLATSMSEVDVSAVETCLAFLRTAGDVNMAFREHFARYDLSEGKFAILMLLRRSAPEGLAPSVLAEKAGVTRATVTGLLDGLERAELVERKSHPQDRRMVTVYLTAGGQAFLDRMLPDHFRRTAALMSGLTEIERQLLLSLLQKVREGIPGLMQP